MARTGASQAIRAELLRLELALASRDPSGLTVPLGQLIADDFVEFGASGAAWTADSVRDMLVSPTQAKPTFEDFEVAALANDVMLVTYRVATPVRSNRSSVWVRRDGSWRIRFHQGTRA